MMSGTAGGNTIRGGTDLKREDGSGRGVVKTRFVVGLRRVGKIKSEL